MSVPHLRSAELRAHIFRVGTLPRRARCVGLAIRRHIKGFCEPRILPLAYRGIYGRISSRDLLQEISVNSRHHYVPWFGPSARSAAAPEICSQTIGR